MLRTKFDYTEQDYENLDLISEALRERRLLSEIQSYIPQVELLVFKPQSKQGTNEWISTGIQGLLVCTFDSTTRAIQIHLIHPLLQQVVFSHLNVFEFIEQSSQFYSFDAMVPPSTGSTEIYNENNWNNPLEFIGYDYIVGLQLPSDADTAYAKDFYNTVTSFLKLKQDMNVNSISDISDSSLSDKMKLEEPPKISVSEMKPTITLPITGAAHFKRPQSADYTMNPQIKILHKSLTPQHEMQNSSRSSSSVTNPVVIPAGSSQQRQQMVLSSPPKKMKKPSLFSKLFHRKSKETKSNKDSKNSNRVSLPRNFTHVAHIAYSEKTGFTNLNEEWKNIFSKAGITEKELRDPQTAAFLLKAIGVLADEHQKSKQLPLPPKPSVPMAQQQNVVHPPLPSLPPPPLPTQLLKETEPTVTSSISTPPPPPPPLLLPSLSTTHKNETTATTLSGKKDVMEETPRTQPSNLLEQIRNFKWHELANVEENIQEMKKDENVLASKLVNIIEMHRRGREASPESDSEFSDA